MTVDKSLIAGSTTMLVLKLLDGQDMYGYQMIEELSRRSERAFALVAEVGQKLVFDERSRFFPPQLLSRGAGKLGKGFRQSQGRRPLSARDRPQW